MYKIAHLSDIHIFALNRFKPWTFLNKRILGGANLLMHRYKMMGKPVVERALSKISALDVDHICFSGDITNLALEDEYKAASDLIFGIEDAYKRVSIVPGNHDYYTPDSEKSHRFETYFGSLMQTAMPAYQTESHYPYCKFLGDDIALIGLNTAHAMPWFVAAGYVSKKELRATEKLLKHSKVKDRFKIVMLHHPLMPYKYAKIQSSRHLRNAENITQILREQNVDLVMHGHNHYYHHHILPHLKGMGQMHICEPGSASVEKTLDPLSAGKFNVYTIDDKKSLLIQTYIYDAPLQSFKLWRTSPQNISL